MGSSGLGPHKAPVLVSPSAPPSLQPQIPHPSPPANPPTAALHPTALLQGAFVPFRAVYY